MNLLELYPFITVIYNKKINAQYPVVVDLISKHYISFYNLNELDKKSRHELLDICNLWYKKDIKIPLSLYYKESIKNFSKYLEYLENNEYEIVEGFKGTNLKNLSEKRIKRKVIHLD